MKKEEHKYSNFSFHRFFSRCNCLDAFLIFIGTTASMIAGFIIPSISILIGSIAENLKWDNLCIRQLNDQIIDTTKTVLIVTCVIFIFSYIFYSFWMIAASRITLKLRKIYLRALLKQEIEYFEKNNIEELPSQIGEIFDTIERAIGE